MYPPESPPAFMYWMVVPDFGGRTTAHPGELLTGTDDDVVVVGGVVVVEVRVGLDWRGDGLSKPSRPARAPFYVPDRLCAQQADDRMAIRPTAVECGCLRR